MRKLLLFSILFTSLFSYTQPANNDCSGAMTIPVNDQLICDVTVEAIFADATLSDNISDCIGSDDYDVWFEFTATNDRHRVNYNILSGAEVDIDFTLYEGGCSELILVECVNDLGIMEGLVPGTTYKLQAHAPTPSLSPIQSTVFTVCINVPLNVITTSNTAYTPEELIEDILISSDCMTISNVSYSSLENGDPTPGLGYFNKNNSLFNFENGVILSSGQITNAPGPAVGPTSSTTNPTNDDSDLSAIMVDNGYSGTFYDAASLEFDFIPTIDHISFDFIFASNEYGIYQCGFADAFAFILTDVASGEVTNLAVIPNTDIPVSVVTIRNSLYNSACPSANVQYFDSYYTAQDVTAPVNFKGITVPLTAESDVVPGNTYHIKLVIADYNDSAFDSAVFINGGNFNIGSPEYAEITTSNSTVLCEGDSTTLSINLDNSFGFTWYLDGVEIIGENSNNITVTQPGEYTVNVVLPDESCNLSYSINITGGGGGLSSDFTIDDILAFEANSDGVFNFNLFAKKLQIIQSLNLQDIYITFYNTLEDANNATDEIWNDNYPNSENPETIYVRIENTLTGCYSLSSFQLIVLDENYTTPPPAGAQSQSYTEGSTLADIVIEGENIQWYANDATAGRSAMNTQDEEETPLPLDTPLVNGTTYYATQTIYGIESEERLAVTVYLSTPFTISNPDDLTTCSTINNNVGEFNLTLNSANALQGLNPELYTVTYYNGYPTNNTENEIANPENYTSTENGQTIGIRVTENFNQENFADAAFLLIVNPTPSQPEVNDLFINDTDNDGVIVTDLTVTAQEILSGQPQEVNIITYYETASAAEVGTPAITSPEAYMVTTQTVYFRIESIEGCFTTGSFNVIVNTIAGLEDFNKDNLNFYPNPVTEVLHINNSNKILHVSVYNLIGQKVVQQNFNTDDIQLNLHGLTQGIYIVKVFTAESEKMFKITKE